MPTLSSCFISILLGSWYSRGKIELIRSFGELVYYLGMIVEEYLRGNYEISQTSFVEDTVEASFFSPHFSDGSASTSAAESCQAARFLTTNSINYTEFNRIERRILQRVVQFSWGRSFYPTFVGWSEIAFSLLSRPLSFWEPWFRSMQFWLMYTRIVNNFTTFESKVLYYYPRATMPFESFDVLNAHQVSFDIIWNCGRFPVTFFIFRGFGNMVSIFAAVTILPNFHWCRICSSPNSNISTNIL